jgi:hypothetical protein
MGNWRKLLASMASDPRPITYHYEDAARILARLGFEEAPNSGSSHRKWRLRPPGRPPIIVGLVKGTGPLRREYIQDMIRTLAENDLLPKDPLPRGITELPWEQQLGLPPVFPDAARVTETRTGVLGSVPVADAQDAIAA